MAITRPPDNQRRMHYIGMMTDSPTIGGTPRATQRPATLAVPAHWTNEAAPAPQPVPFAPRTERGRPDPVRYGDWESKGIAIDF
jgi:hypothetical protein